VDLMAYLHSNLSSGITMWGDFWGPWGHISEEKGIKNHVPRPPSPQHFSNN